MNIRERLELRAVINMIIGIIESLAKLFSKAQEKFGPKPKIDNNPDAPVKPNRPRPLKRVVDTIDNIIPLPFPWKDKK
jgi:hypothetical protein